MSSQEFYIHQEQEHDRLDLILVKQFPEYSRSYYQYLLKQGAIKVNQKEIKKRYKPKINDHIQIKHIPLPEIKVKPENIALDIIFEDAHIIVINKPAGMCTHPSIANTSNTIAGALCYYIKELKEFNDNLRPGIVHRLDKETSGVLIAAKTPQAHQILCASFKSREVKKTYLALCHNVPNALESNHPIFRDQFHRQRMAVDYEKGRACHTQFKILNKNGLYSLVQAHPTTGRTHQIRVHLKALLSPIVGDKLYAKNAIAKRQLLHAKELEINHPITKKTMRFQAPLANDFIQYYKKLIQDEKNPSLI